MAIVSKEISPLHIPAVMLPGILRPGVLVAEDRPCDIAEAAALFSSPSLAICWHYERNNVIITGNTGEYAYGRSYEDSLHHMFDVEQVEDLILGPMHACRLGIGTYDRKDFNRHVDPSGGRMCGRILP